MIYRFTTKALPPVLQESGGNNTGCCVVVSFQNTIVKRKSHPAKFPGIIPIVYF
jgi:hypothetical protein